MSIKVNLLLLAGFLSVLAGNGQVKLPVIFGDHMVIQRDQPVSVWGWSSPNEKIVVKMNQQVKETKADQSGKWLIKLDPQPAGGPYDLTVEGKNRFILHDVQIGEVWICSGQSNMEFQLNQVRNATTEIKESNYPEIRQIKVALRVSDKPKEDIPPAKWEVSSDLTSGNFTAVGYFFARELVKQLHVAVGLINSTWGGTMVETWTSRGAFEKSPEFQSMIATKPGKDIEEIAKQKQHALVQYISILQKNISDSLPESDWKNPDYNSQAWPKISVASTWENQDPGLNDLDGIVWYRKEVTLNADIADKPLVLSLGKIDDFDESYVNGVLVGSTRSYNEDRLYRVPVGVFKAGRNVIAVRVEDTGGGGGFYGDSTGISLNTSNGNIPLGNNWVFRIAKSTSFSQGAGPNDYPCLLYNAMIHPLIPYGIRGAIWYQGEANADRAFQYRTAFPLMITDWRQHWGEGDFPFYFVQLASFNSANGNSQQGSAWAELREAQTKTLSLPNTGMSITTDIGESNDIHPKNKQDVGFRLAVIALNNIYKQPMEFSGPVYESMHVEGNKIVLSFTHTGTGLMIKDKYGYIRGFEIAGPDHHFHYAKAFIQHNEIFVYSEEVEHPEALRYGWADDAGDCNLYNKEGLPAGPFRTDQWKGITDDKKYAIGK